jgi:tetratricopeptide (TPR) repeat protein
MALVPVDSRTPPGVVVLNHMLQLCAMVFSTRSFGSCSEEDVPLKDTTVPRLGSVTQVVPVRVPLRPLPVASATVLNSLAVDLSYQGRFAEGLEYLGRALMIRQQTGNRYGEGLTESTLGDTYSDLGRYQEAIEHYRRARQALQATACEHLHHADVLCGLGSALASLGRTAEATEAWRAALPLLDRSGDSGPPTCAAGSPAAAGCSPACCPGRDPNRLAWRCQSPASSSETRPLAVSRPPAFFR